MISRIPFFVRSLAATLFTAMAALSLGAAQPETTIPSDSNLREHPEWNKDCIDNVAAMQGQRCDVIFIGDSITGMWGSVGKDVWAKHFAPLHALNFGAGGDRTQNVLYRLNTYKVHDFKPKVAVVLIGTNNIGDPVEDITDGVKAVLTRTSELYPTAKIILVSILPRAEHAAKIDKINAVIRGFADGKAIRYLDLASKFPPAGDSWKGLGPDKLHLSADGYQVYAEALEPLLTELLAK